MPRQTNLNSTLVEIIKTLAVRLVSHPWVANPRIFMPDGMPVRITKVRTLVAGVAPENQKGITLSINPYTFTDKNNAKLAATSHNASYTITPGQMGQGNMPQSDQEHYHLCTAYLQLTLQMFKYAIKSTPRIDLPGETKIDFQNGTIEQVLMDYTEMIETIIRCSHTIFNLKALDNKTTLVKSITVNWVNFPTIDWQQGANAVNHESHVVLTVLYRKKDSIEVDSGKFSSLTGPVGVVPDPADPTQLINVGYDWVNCVYYRVDTEEVLSYEHLTDPVTGTMYSTINTSVVALHIGTNARLVPEYITMEPTT